MEFCIQYLEGNNGLLLDMPFLAHIKEGEILVLMLRNKVFNVVHKSRSPKKMLFLPFYFPAQNTDMTNQKSGQHVVKFL